ncbi:MAG TPA: pseudouridine synthase [Verrucomicrobiae bacterium]
MLFEDDHLLVINKPAGLNTHAPGPFAGEGLYDWLRHREPRWATLAIIHRLDKETSGLMVFGKTPLANRLLTEQFAEHSVRKKYLLLTDRVVKPGSFTAESALARAGDKYLSRPLHAGGERAETRFRSIGRNGNNTLVEAEPVTGRTHQIRVHAAEHGFPILGDTLYGGTAWPRVCLHAAALTLRDARSKIMTFEDAPDFSADHRQTLRAAMIEPAQTEAFRLIHGASDGWPGCYVDRLGDYALAQSERELTEAQGQLMKIANGARTPRPREPIQPEHADEASALLHELALTDAPRCHLETVPGIKGLYQKRLNRQIRRSSPGEASPQLMHGQGAPERFVIRENGLRFELSFKEGYSAGLFLDQRDNRRRFLVNHVAAGFPLFPDGAEGAEVLNTFAYTCGFSVAAARAGARATSLDLSKKYLEWGRRNFVWNGLDPARHDFIHGDVFDWLRRLAKKKRAFDAIVLDPPTFSQSKEHGVFRAEKDYGELIGAALPVLKPNGVVFASANAAGLKPEEFLDVIEAALARARRSILQRHYVPQPPDFPMSRAEPAHLKTFWLRLR